MDELGALMRIQWEYQEYRTVFHSGTAAGTYSGLQQPSIWILDFTEKQRRQTGL